MRDQCDVLRPDSSCLLVYRKYLSRCCAGGDRRSQGELEPCA